MMFLSDKSDDSALLSSQQFQRFDSGSHAQAVTKKVGWSLFSISSRWA